MATHLLLRTTILIGLCFGLYAKNVFASSITSCDQAPGCYYDDTTAGNSLNLTTGDSSTVRSWSVYVPATYRFDPINLTPAIFDFHGAKNSPDTQYNNSQYYLNPNAQKYLVFYPAGLLDSEGISSWMVDPYNQEDDIGFISALLSHVQQVYSIDPNKIFASGKSQGGGFVDYIACSDLGDNFAAFAMASPALYKHALNSSCTIVKPRKILEAHGDGDKVIPYGGKLDRGVHLPCIGTWSWWWAWKAGYRIQQHINKNPSGYSIVSYTSTTNSTVVTHYYVEDNGHCWPQTEAYPANTDYSKTSLRCNGYALDFTDEVIKFFEAAVPTTKQNGVFTQEL